MDSNINSCLSEQELAEKLNLSYWTVRQLRIQQGLPHIKCGKRIFYRWLSVQSWFDQQEQSVNQITANPIRVIG